MPELCWLNLSPPSDFMCVYVCDMNSKKQIKYPLRTGADAEFYQRGEYLITSRLILQIRSMYYVIVHKKIRSGPSWAWPDYHVRSGTSTPVVGVHVHVIYYCHP